MAINSTSQQKLIKRTDYCSCPFAHLLALASPALWAKSGWLERLIGGLKLSPLFVYINKSRHCRHAFDIPYLNIGRAQTLLKSLAGNSQK